MVCFHCKRTIKAKEPRSYVPYKRGTLWLRRYWCQDCDAMIDAEYPVDTESA